MQTGAVIVAAGMSSRMGDFKPMLNIGSITIAQRIVATFQQAGIDKIVIITGYNAEMLERHLANNGLIFLRNANYETTHMFDSACIGFNYLKEKCDRILFTPVDIPLFTADTVTKLIENSDPIVCPVCDEKRGHPILLSSEVIEKILCDSGEGGLNGALMRCGTAMTLLPVNDSGILHDADTPDDYKTLLSYHNSQLIRPIVSVSLSKEKPFFDGKMFMLLTLVDETKSVRTACKRMQISYSTGWNILRTLESQLNKELIVRSQGGAGGGQSDLTEYGRQFLSLFESYQKKIRDYSAELFDEHFKDAFT